jgi:hypothetical protein
MIAYSEMDNNVSAEKSLFSREKDTIFFSWLTFFRAAIVGCPEKGPSNHRARRGHGDFN